MNKYASILAIIILVSISAGMVKAEDALEIMKKSHLAYYYAGDDGVSKVTMKIINKKGKERVREFTMIRLDLEEGGNQKYYTYFSKPSDVSRMTFMVWKNTEGNDDRWLYIPAIDLVKRISADDKNSSFVGSDFSYEDVSGRLWTEDDHTLVSETETINDKSVFLISSKSKKEKDSFSEKKSWIDKETYLPLREEYFDKKGKLFRIFTAERIEVIDDIVTITQRSMENVKKNQKTIISFDNIEYNLGVTDDIFTERFLKSPPRKFLK